MIEYRRDGISIFRFRVSVSLLTIFIKDFHLLIQISLNNIVDLKIGLDQNCYGNYQQRFGIPFKKPIVEIIAVNVFWPHKSSLENYISSRDCVFKCL